MKKSRLLALTLVVAIALMGAGYAYWTQTLTIQNTISTGELNVVFTELELNLPENDTYLDVEKSDFDFAKVDGKDDPYNLQLVLEKAYPGAEFNLTFTMDNTGTLGAYVRNFELINDINENADLVYVKGYELEGTTLINKNYNQPLSEFLKMLNRQKDNKGIWIEKEEDVKFILDLEISEQANSDSESANFLKENTDNAIVFTITSVARQYNAPRLLD